MAKGGNFELKIAKLLSLWFSNGKRDDLICRTDSSGGRATVRMTKNKKSSKYWYGDLKNSDDVARPVFDKWSIECKTGYSRKNKQSITRWDVLDVLDSFKKKHTIGEMWGQCKRDAKLSKRTPVLIFGRSLRFPCIAFDASYFFEVVTYENNLKSVIVSFNNDSIIIFRLNDFLKKFSKNEFFEEEK